MGLLGGSSRVVFPGVELGLRPGGLAIREFLAKRIVEMGHQGERNVDLLVADALAHLSNSNWYPVG